MVNGIERSIRLADLEEAYQMLKALNDIHFAIAKGSIVLLSSSLTYVVGEFRYENTEWVFDSLRYGEEWIDV